MSPRMPGARLVRRYTTQPRLEKHEQADIQKLAIQIGGSAWVLGTHRKKGDYQGTCQTPGLPDLLVFLPIRHAQPGAPTRHLVVVEAKRVKAHGVRAGRLREEQQDFRDECNDAHVSHVTGGYQAFVTWLIARGFVKADQFPHYRQRQEPA